MADDDDALVDEDASDSSGFTASRASHAGGQSSGSGKGGGDGGRQSKRAGAAKAAAAAQQQQQQPATELLAGMGSMSARERAAALRRAKSLKRSASAAAPLPTSPTKRVRAEQAATGASATQETAQVGDGSAADAAATAAAAEQEWQDMQAGRWPFQTLCDQLCLDTLHRQWEVRHGAAVGLREVLLSQAAAAGVHAPLAAALPGGGEAQAQAQAQAQQQVAGGGWTSPGGSGPLPPGPVTQADVAAAAAANRAWLEDCASHLLAVLALDRFGDYLSDQVVAPVRETAAQALGAAARALPRDALLAAVAALGRMAASPTAWEARHGALLGLKYVLAAQAGSASSDGGGLDQALLAAALPLAARGLRDGEDEVQAVAAEALLPAAAQLAAGCGSGEALQVLRLLWDALLGLDQLSPACASVMTLLAALYSAGAGTATIKPEAGVGAGAGDLGALLPRLWPYLHHGLSSVRLAAARCLGSLLAARPVPDLLPGGEAQRCARLLFQSLLLERNDEALAASQGAWAALVRRAPPALLAAALPPPVLAGLFRLAATPPHRALPAEDMLEVAPAAAPKSAAASRAASAAALAAAQQQQQPAAQPVLQQGQQLAHVVEADGDAAATTRMRLAAAEALGQLAAALGACGTPSPALEPALATLHGESAAGRLLGGLLALHWARETASRAPAAPALPASPTAQAAAGATARPGADLRQLAAAALELLGPGIALQAQTQAGLAEVAPLRAQLRAQAQALIQRALAAGLPLAMPAPLDALTGPGGAALASQVPAGAPAEIVQAAAALAATAGQLATTEAFLQTSVGAALAAAVVEVSCRRRCPALPLCSPAFLLCLPLLEPNWLAPPQTGELPHKLNSLIQPLVAAVRREPQPRLQQVAAAALARLALLAADRTPSPTDK